MDQQERGKWACEQGWEGGAEDSGTHWGWAGVGEEETLGLPRPPQLVSASAASAWASPAPSPQHRRGLAGAIETWEPPLPTTPTVLESGEQMSLLAKQLVKQTVCFRAFCFEADFVVGVV